MKKALAVLPLLAALVMSCNLTDSDEVEVALVANRSSAQVRFAMSGVTFDLASGGSVVALAAWTADVTLLPDGSTMKYPRVGWTKHYDYGSGGGLRIEFSDAEPTAEWTVRNMTGKDVVFLAIDISWMTGQTELANHEAAQWALDNMDNYGEKITVNAEGSATVRTYAESPTYIVGPQNGDWSNFNPSVREDTQTMLIVISAT